MTTEITPNTSVESLRRNVGKGEREKLRTSAARRDYLNRLASIHAGTDVYVQISGEQAYADTTTKKDRAGYHNRKIINVPEEIPDQQVTDLDGKAWDLLFQKVEMYHELGHIKYTDWPSIDGFFDSLTGRYRNRAQMYWNLLEDVAIERLLAQRYNVADDLWIKNENIMPNFLTKRDWTKHSISDGIAAALAEYKHPIGEIHQLLDPRDDTFQFKHHETRQFFKRAVVPIIEDHAEGIASEPDAEERNQKFIDFWNEIEPILQDMEPQKDAEVNERDGQEIRGEDGAEDPEMEGAIPSMQGEMEMELDPDSDSEPKDGEEGQPIPGGDHDIVRSYGEEVERQEQEAEDPMGDEAEEFLRIIQTNYEENRNTTVLAVDEDPDEKYHLNEDTYREAKRMSRPLADELEQRLQQERRTRKQRGKRWGKLDPQRLHRTERGDTRVFAQNSKPDGKDYAAIVLLDRSGSMRDMPAVEEAAGAISFAMHEVGIEAGVLSLYGGQTILSHPLGEDPEHNKKRLFNGSTGGGTPLSDSLFLARERLQEHDAENVFVIVVTDGRPDHHEAYRDELHACDFPVLGIYLDDGFGERPENDSAYFDYIEYASPEASLKAARRLIGRVVI